MGAVDGVDIHQTAKLLGQDPLYLQHEVSVFGKIPPHLIEGVLEINQQGNAVWHKNPNFVAPAAAADAYYIYRTSKVTKVMPVFQLPVESSQNDTSDDSD